MKNYFIITLNELNHLKRSKFKIISLILYTIAIIYSCQNGFELYKKHNSEINIINENIKESINENILQYKQIESGEIDKPRRDPTTPYWAIRNTSSYVFKHPSKLMTFSVGQSEQYGYYKYIKNWSTVFDNDLAKEIANPERLAIGTLDFSFVFLFLTPILLIILLFNIGGLEKDLGFDQLIYLNNISKKTWLFFRFIFYYISIIIIIVSLMIPYTFITGAIFDQIQPLIKLFLIIIFYQLFWFGIFYFINIFGNGSSDQAIKMISIWLIFCIIIPGTIHQISTIKYPLNYMTEYIDTNRDISNDIFELSSDSLQIKLLNAYPQLKNTFFGTDTTIRKSIINRSLSGLINILNKDISDKIEKRNESKNNFIKNLSLINPVIFFQNKINSITQTDYYTYKQFRIRIQEKIDKQINRILLDTWNNVKVNKKKYLQYIESFK